MSTVGNGTALRTYSQSYSILPTDKLVAEAREKWHEIRDNIDSDEALEFDTILTSVLSRLTGVNEVVNSGKFMAGASK